MATTAELRGRVSLDGSPFRRELAQIRRQAARFGREVGPSFAAIGPKIATLAAQVAGLGAALAGIGVKKNFDLESMEVQFVSLLGSAEAATKRVAELKRFAASTPFQIEEIAAVNKMLETVGQGGEDMLALVGDAAAATGTEFRDLGRIMQKALAMQKAGVALGDVINQLNERAILSADAFKQLREESAAGLSTPRTLQILLGELGKFQGSMERLSRTGAGLFSTLKDNAGFALAEITKGFADASKGGIQLMIDKIQELSDSGTFQRWGQYISQSIQRIINAWQSLSDAQKTAILNMAKAGAGFVVAWRAGLVQPLISMTAALAARIMGLMNAKILLGGLAGAAAFITGLGIGEAIEKQFQLSSILLKFAAWGKALVNKAVAIVAAIVSPFVNVGQMIDAAMSGDMVAAEQFADMAVDVNRKGQLLGKALDDIEANYQADLADIASVSVPPPKFNLDAFLKLAGDEIADAFRRTGKLAVDQADLLRKRLAEQMGLDDVGDALGAFIEGLKVDPVARPVEDIGNQAKAAGVEVEALGQKIKNLSAPFRGGKIESFDIGAQIAKVGPRFGGAAGLLQEFRGGLRGGMPISPALPEPGAAAGAERLRQEFNKNAPQTASAPIEPRINVAPIFDGLKAIAPPPKGILDVAAMSGKGGRDAQAVKIAGDQLKVNKDQLAELKKIGARGGSVGMWY